VAVGVSVQQPDCGAEQARSTNLDDLGGFRDVFYDCLTLRADALFELTDAVLCSDGPVTTLVGLTLTAEHRRGHGALYDGLGSGRIQVDRLRRSLANLPVPRDAQGRITLGVDVSPWLRPDAATTADRSFCHVYGRGKGQAQMIPGWPYSFVAALESGRTSWTTLLDAVRVGPGDDATEVTATQVREVIERLQQARHWKPGDADILVVFDAGYDVTRLAFLLADLPVELLGRLRWRPGLLLPRLTPGRQTRSPAQARPRVRAGETRYPAHARGHHPHPDQSLWHRAGPRLAPAAPQTHPPRRVG
jgi:hypothetical protein